MVLTFFHLAQEQFLHLTLPEGTGINPQKVGGAKMWEVAAYKKRHIINLGFSSKVPGVYKGSVFINTDVDNMVSPSHSTTQYHTVPHSTTQHHTAPHSTT
jgi:hypothetical protein